MCTDEASFHEFPSKDKIANVYNEFFLTACRTGFIVVVHLKIMIWKRLGQHLKIYWFGN